MPKKNFHALAATLQSTMKEVLPSMVDSRVNEIAKKTVPLYVAKGLLLDRQKTQIDEAAMIDEAIQKERENLRVEITLQVTNAIANSIPPKVDSFLRNYMANNILYVHPTQADGSSAQDLQYQLTATVRTRDHEDHHDDDARPEGVSSANRQKTTNDDEVPTEEVSLELMRRALKPTPIYHSCQRDPKALLMTSLNQDLFYLKYGNPGPKKYTLSLHKYPAVPFRDDDIEEQTSRWVSKCIRRFNVYARYSVEHWKNLLAKQDHIRMQMQNRDKPEEIDLITEPDYKYLNKNDIEDLYLLCNNGKVKDYRENGLLGSLSIFIRSTVIWERVHDFQLGMKIYQQKVNLTAPTITFPSIERKKLFSITYEPVVGMIYENNKKEKRVMIHKEIHKICEATLKRVLEKLKKYNKDVKYGYANLSPMMQMLNIYNSMKKTLKID
ncbi:hypothetical protein Tco_0967459 [Tanacetum coccineum]